MNRRHLLAATVFAAYAGTVYGANWLIAAFPDGWPVWPGIAAPAGVYAAGLALGLRDWLQQLAGKWAALAGIAVGSLLSWFLADPAFAVASVVAFGVSELADMAVYTPLRERRLYLAVAASGVVGLAVDSLLFLQLAFGDLGFLWGQVIGKAWMTLLALGVVWLYRNRHTVASWVRARRRVRRAA